VAVTYSRLSDRSLPTTFVSVATRIVTPAKLLKPVKKSSEVKAVHRR